jgi:uncharacterized protein DUF6893
MKKLGMLALIGAVAAVAAQQAPEVKRYLKVRQM